MRQQRGNVLPSVSCGQRLENKELYQWTLKGVIKVKKCPLIDIYV